MKRLEVQDGPDFAIKCYLCSPLHKRILFWLIVGLTGGVFWLLLSWFDSLEVKLRYSECGLETATHVYIEHRDGGSIEQLRARLVPKAVFGDPSSDLVRITSFEFRKLKYVLDDQSDKWTLLEFNTTLPYSVLYPLLRNSQSSHVEASQQLFGPCGIEVPMPHILELLVKEIAHPFFVFQIFSVIIWCLDAYILLAMIILCLSFLSVIATLVETRKNIQKIRHMAQYECPVKVLRYREAMTLSSFELVPGDLIFIPSNCKMPCDAVVLKGSCVVDEAMLTGETVPVIKDHITEGQTGVYSRRLTKQHTVYGGTEVLHCEEDTIAAVVATGYSTAKGQIVQSILYPKPTNFKFYEDSFKFVFILAMIAVLGFAWCIPSFIAANIKTEFVILRALDLITITVPPTLPLAMTIGTAFAIYRLKSKGIVCISPQKVNVAGKVTVFCFDKTGTLTEDSMSVHAIEDQGVLKTSGERLSTLLAECLANCHELSFLQGELKGDSQELALFTASGWSREDSQDYGICKRPIDSIQMNPTGDTAHLSHKCRSPEEISGLGYQLPDYKAVYTDGTKRKGQLKMFHFNSQLKRMGVIVKDLRYGDLMLHVKGAPEEVLKRCRVLPEEIERRIYKYARSGLRVMACAYKAVTEAEVSADSLEQVEQGLEFLGLALLTNSLKPQSAPCIETLKKANVSCIMSTGDALLTGIAMSQSCGILVDDSKLFLGQANNGVVYWEDLEGNSVSANDIMADTAATFAISGPALESMLEQGHDLGFFLSRTPVFGRMSPKHKTSLVETLQAYKLVVGMCGDGANDCGALSAADIGVSVSNAESSIAAPFTGKNVSCVVEVLIEGKGALVTSFQCFKFMALYSLIQFVTVSALYILSNNFADIQYLYIDLFTILPLAVFMSTTHPFPLLTHKKPPGALISAPVLFSMLGQVFIQAMFIGAAAVLLQLQDWFEPSRDHIERPASSYENTTLFLVSILQYVAVCVSFNSGPPFRLPMTANKSLLVTVLLLSVMAAFFTLLASPLSGDVLMVRVRQLKDIRSSFRVELLVLMAFNAASTALYEFYGAKRLCRLWYSKRKRDPRFI
jgi:cation-transporting ATPase 13A3/4/5